MDTQAIVVALDQLMPDSKILADVDERLAHFAEGDRTTIHVDGKPLRVPRDVPIRIISKTFSMAYLPDHETTVDVVLAVNFEPAGFDSRLFDPERHCFGLMQYGTQSGYLFVLAFRTEYPH